MHELCSMLDCLCTQIQRVSAALGGTCLALQQSSTRYWQCFSCLYLPENAERFFCTAPESFCGSGCPRCMPGFAIDLHMGVSSLSVALDA